ncbi:hypothetical protein GCM10007285_34680 [Stappia taiwanensis]|nr:hypothetical protein GCM10007285_34680 [Stappia taiwanensis]
MKAALRGQIVDIAALAGDKPPVLAPAQGLTHPALSGLVDLSVRVQERFSARRARRAPPFLNFPQEITGDIYTTILFHRIN